MKNLVYVLLATVALVACNNNVATLNINVPTAKDSTSIEVSKLSLNMVVVEDTLYTVGGKASLKLNVPAESPEFYYLRVGGEKSVSLLVEANNNIDITVEGDQTKIEGSEESVLMNKLDREFDVVYKEFHALTDPKEMSKLYVEYHKDCIRHIMKNSTSMTAVPTLYRKFSNQVPVFSNSRDVFLFRRVYDSLKTRYPKSPYIVSIADEVTQRENLMKLEESLATVEEIGFPNLFLPDTKGEIKTLADLKGKVIILSFWSSNVPEQKLFNMELKKIYDKYSSKGLEVYQVSLDTDKTAWSQVVKSQGLSWISVCDGLGTASRALTTYNIQEIPTMFIINKDGDMVEEKNVFDTIQLERIIKKLL